jgi:hypothetical protein
MPVHGGPQQSGIYQRKGKIIILLAYIHATQGSKLGSGRQVQERENTFTPQHLRKTQGRDT